jgi:hypothetical protein
MRDATLLDGKTAVASDQLVSNMLKAALLAQEQSGVIRLEFDGTPGGGKSNSLMIVPTGAKKEWPPATMEARLLVSRPASVADIVFDWLAEESNDPWHRAAEQGKIMLVLRGIAEVALSKWGTRKYVLSEDASAVVSETSAQPVLDLLAECSQSRPEIWTSLDEGIRKAIQRRRSGQNEKRSQGDPWLAESLADQKKYAVYPKPKVVPAFILVPLSLAVALFDWWFAVRTGLGVFALVTAGLLTIVLGLSLLPFQFVRDFQKHISAWIAGRMPVPIDLPDPSSYSWKHKAGGTVLGVAAMTAAALIGVKYIQAGLFLLAAGWGACKLYSALYWLFARKAAAAINTRVTGTEAFLDTRVSSGPTPPDAPSTAGSPASSQRSLRQPLPVGLEMVTAETLPPVSEESSRKLESIGLRGPSVRRAYRKGILILSASTVVLAIIYWLTGSSPFNFKVPSNPQGWRLPERMPAFLFVLFLITLVMLSRRGAAWFRGVVVSNLLSAMTGAEVSSPPLAIEEGGASIRPIGLPFLGGLWVLLILTLTPSRYASLEVPQGLLFAGASLGVLFGYLYWIWKRTKALEHQYPYQPPFNLLALRVFGSPHLSDFLDLTSSWQWIGTRQMLDGPDTVGHKFFRRLFTIQFMLGKHDPPKSNIRVKCPRRTDGLSPLESNAYAPHERR